MILILPLKQKSLFDFHKVITVLYKTESLSGRPSVASPTLWDPPWAGALKG